MKRAKAEQLKGVVVQYMKRRQYQDGEIQLGRKEQTADLEEMSVKKKSRLSTGIENSTSCSSITGDFGSCDQQFARLRKFILESAPAQNRELSALLYPVFVHIYSDLLSAVQKNQAHKFHERHNEIFHDEDQKDFIRSLRKLESRTELQATTAVTDFKEHKYSVRLSHASVAHLLKHLKAADNMIILQIINQHINFQVTNTEGKSLDLRSSQPHPRDHNRDKEKETDGIKKEIKKEIKSEKEESVPEEDSQLSPAEAEQLRALKEISRKVRNVLPALPSICFYTFINAHQGLCTSTISPDSKLICGGFEDSSIQLWRLQPVPLPAEPTNCSNRHIPLAADYLYKTQEERTVKIDRESQEAVTFRAHSGPVYKTSFTPDSLFILSGSRDCTARLWDVAKRTNTVIYRGHSGPVWDLDFCPATSHFATSSYDQTVKLWTIDRIYPLRSFIGHTQDVESVAIHPNGNYVASGSCDKTIRLWNIQDGKPMRLLTGHRGSVLALAFSPDGKMLASAGEDRRIHVWDLGSGSLMKELRGHTDTVYSLSFSHCNRMVASGGLDCVLRIWDVRHGTEGGASALIEGHTSSELLGAYPTKSATMSFLRFARSNLLQAAGANQ
ncbi:TAF5-like RNA polymerase II p300/CBP-associated factor-associated factor 65 kDa subunit 5L [Littorina saxatilis]|uniref:TFIID subunit TAF5 NTD2 domain-containing protein n=1 Tax=Littorina saxatilis TaxID=31220 RepID=A0AAN9ARQ8_9CAEN